MSNKKKHENEFLIVFHCQNNQKTVPVKILYKGMLMIDFCTVLHKEQIRAQRLSSTSQMQVLLLPPQLKVWYSH